jgi:hypothetical protein
LNIGEYSQRSGTSCSGWGLVLLFIGEVVEIVVVHVCKELTVGYQLKEEKVREKEKEDSIYRRGRKEAAG